MAKNTKKEPQSLHTIESSKTKNNNIIIAKHYVAVHPKKYKNQPKKVEIGKVTNDFKRNLYINRLTITDLMKHVEAGQCIIPANFEIENELDKGNVETIRFVSSTLIFIDVDDLSSKVDPIKILNMLTNATGIFYTFNHLKKGNRFRVIFQLDKPIVSERIYKKVAELLQQEVNSKIASLYNGYNCVDMHTVTPTIPIRTGNFKSVITKPNTYINTLAYTDKAVALINNELLQMKSVVANFTKHNVSFNELKAMCETISYIPSNQQQHSLWSKLVLGIKSYYLAGAITETEGYELYSILSGPEANYKTWLSLKPRIATIGSIIYEAKRRGYRFKKTYAHAKSNSNINYNKTLIEADQYIPANKVTEILSKNKRILVESPTGSGKTKEFINAMKNAADKKINHLYLFAAPTKALVQQISNDYSVNALHSDTVKPIKKAIALYSEGERCFVATYDLASILIAELQKNDTEFTYTLIVDEYHKLVTDYTKNYRQDVLTRLNTLSSNARCFIALSGTVQDILKDDFHEVFSVNTKKNTSQPNEFAVYTYNKKAEAMPNLVKLIESWTKKRKLLIFLQSKELITQLYDLLRKRGIVTRTITSNEKCNETYKNIVEKGTVADDVQVILSTTVIADGISIQNSYNWECIVVSNEQSLLFNISTIKQMSHRFRKNYSRFSVFMLEPKRNEDSLYNIDSAYSRLSDLAEYYCNCLNAQGFSEHDYHASILEQDCAIVFENNKFIIDKLKLRNIVSNEKENYYKTYRKAFIKAIEIELKQKCAGVLNISEAIQANNLDLTDIHADMAALKASNTYNRAEKKNNITKVFTKETFTALKTKVPGVINTFKQQVVSEHFTSIQNMIDFSNYETCFSIVTQIKRRSDANAFINRIKAIVDIAYFENTSKMTLTKAVYLDIKKNLLGKTIQTKELKNYRKHLTNKFKLSGELINKVINQMFDKKYSRSNKARFITLQPISAESIAIQFKIKKEYVIDTINNYSEALPEINVD